MFRVVIYPEAASQLAELPSHLLAAYASALDAIASEREVHVLRVVWLELPR